MPFSKIVFSLLHVEKHENLWIRYQKWNLIVLPWVRLALWVAWPREWGGTGTVWFPRQGHKTLWHLSGSLQFSTLPPQPPFWCYLLQPSHQVKKTSLYGDATCRCCGWQPRLSSQPRANNRQLWKWAILDGPAPLGSRTTVAILMLPLTPGETAEPLVNPQNYERECVFCLKSLSFGVIPTWWWIIGTHILCDNMLFVLCAQGMIVFVLIQGSLATTL